ncbi:hypothetical protein EMIHUDRAFT_243875 [Emiliania huxleyi CCMP1516]|uniref:Fe2OG dioxygenase domain-containing protein n=2 Tax=Emiliania huxleyi TaxID=2903 RepID=A0A0D3J2A0_EMIH1|nr:hypothetical protein EMIHUDRAFT_243875 [Emiliania huxleyi CCMP1516]EOD17635.1 hypothetical protein EMIHUDRAFT_243875 [Emiliania huxleyi CCMP1516]|eukprot:XP_005770064.1 hypothetical protein EMIHUDRAFT_243875 [Emiliania huxleyi CCMP1516]
MAAALVRALVGLFAVGAGEARRTSLAMQYKPLRRHANLFEDWTEWVHPPLLHAIRSSNASALLDLLREEAGGGDSSGVYSLPLFLDAEGGCAFCDLLLDELDGYYASGLPIERPNSMNNYGIIVNAIGMRPAIDRLQAAAEGGFTSHHSFMVKYKAGQDLGLDMHTDDSDVTVNVCLGKDFRGAANQMRKTETAVCPDEHSRRHPTRCVRPSSTVILRLSAALTVCGDSRSPSHRQFYASYSHERGLAHVRLSSTPLDGRALLHLGSRRHGADDIASGERNNLIVWNQNARRRAAPGRYVNRQPYLREAAPPDKRCLSYTRPARLWRREFRGRGWCPPAFACYDSMAPALKKDEL